MSTPPQRSAAWKWILAYLAYAAILFHGMTSDGWVRLDYSGELIFALIVPLVVLRFFAWFLRLGRFFQPRQTARPKTRSRA